MTAFPAFFEADTPPLMVSMPFDEFMGDETLDIAKVERYVHGYLSPELGNVKQLAAGFKGVDDARLGVAVTFQACLHIDVSAKVVFFHEVDEVLPRPMD